MGDMTERRVEAGAMSGTSGSSGVEPADSVWFGAIGTSVHEGGMDDADLPRWGWGVIDRSAYTSRMPVRLTRPITIDDLPGPLPGFRGELVDHQSSLDSGILAGMQQVINQQAAAAREQTAWLQAMAAALGDPRGIEIGHEIVEAGDDVIRYRTRIRLTEDVPAGEIRYKTGDWV